MKLYWQRWCFFAGERPESRKNSEELVFIQEWIRKYIGIIPQQWKNAIHTRHFAYFSRTSDIFIIYYRRSDHFFQIFTFSKTLQHISIEKTPFLTNSHQKIPEIDRLPCTKTQNTR